jgi:hypothetical protein
MDVNLLRAEEKPQPVLSACDIAEMRKKDTYM